MIPKNAVKVNKTRGNPSLGMYLMGVIARVRPLQENSNAKIKKGLTLALTRNRPFLILDPARGYNSAEPSYLNFC